MNLDKTRQLINSLVGETVTVKVNLGRNKEEVFIGKINNLFPRVFTVKCENVLKSFSYSDVLTKLVKISKI